ncbi:Maltose/maltodextrin ABC transporter, substrate binding periplasmic protein MalE [Photobacterium marinum]|uniref:Maltodextrin-binding protein n=1 Tax=Photobacterium marinum TaxID=1056511 RepID=L8JCC5_9GAMM|nr:maltose ABC transporter substrate-binding protein [Photobacterium marinum]ELR65923.1 Maltose/maltodextrin ABC transporter, substrate binding periplasmic protein MalE [Photobacterium marinum]
MKKIILSALLSSGLMASALPVMASQTIQPEEGAALQVWADKGASTDFMKYAAKEFETKYNIDIDVRSVSPLNAINRLIQDGSSTRVGDIVEFPHDFLGRAVTSGVIMENLVSGDRVDNDFIHSAAVAAKDSKGVTYGFPLSFETLVLFYNKDLLPQTPTSFEQIIEFSKGYTNPKEHKYALLWDIQNYYESRMFLSMYNGYEFGNDGRDANDVGIATTGAVKGIQAMLELRDTTNSNSEDMNQVQVRRGLFTEGKAAAIIDGPWAVEGYINSGINLGAVPVPSFKGKKPTTFASVKMLAVSSFTQYPRAAQLFADFVTSEDMQLKRFEMMKAIPPHKGAMEKLAKTGDAFTKAIIAQGYHADAMPSIPEMGYVWQPATAALADIWNNKADVQASLKKAESVIKQQIAMQQ